LYINAAIQKAGSSRSTGSVALSACVGTPTVFSTFDQSDRFRPYIPPARGTPGYGQ